MRSIRSIFGDQQGGTKLFAFLLAISAGPAVVAIVVAGGGAIGGTARWSAGFAWVLTSIALSCIGALLGFVFAVPRLRSDLKLDESERYLGNSNLEQISDWLTKLLLGAGLVSLREIPGLIGRLGAYFSGIMGGAAADSYASLAVVHGSGVGFFTGYIWTRLRLRLLFERADKDAKRAALEDVVIRKLAQQPGTDESSPDVKGVVDEAVASAEALANRNALPILWVDDYPANNRGIVEALNALGISVVISLSTTDALARLQRENYALIISDLGRREGGTNNPMAGLDLLEAIQTLPIATPCVIFAGPRGVENRAELENAGARLVTQKPSELFREAVRYVTGSTPL